MLREIDASDGRQGGDFRAEKDAGYTSCDKRVLDFDTDHTDSGQYLTCLLVAC